MRDTDKEAGLAQLVVRLQFNPSADPHGQFVRYDG